MLFLSLFTNIFSPYLRYVYLCTNYSIWTDIIDLQYRAEDFPPPFFFPPFERGKICARAFVCFQMIDFGIWATPLAAQS